MELVTHRLLSPAKINLMLRILNKRPDGYHNLQTCFQLLDWGDDIKIQQLDCDTANHIKITGFDDLNYENNLIYKAAQLLKPFAKNQSGWHIDVEKKIPMGAGLGGGSSNAAVVLKFLNQAWQCEFSEDKLIQVGVKLGADVPIFLLGKSALAGGVGNELQMMNFDTPYVLLMFPKCSISTADLFAYENLQRAQSELKINKISDSDFWINDFFPAVLEKEAEVSNVFQQLKNKINIRLSGTGSTLFAVFETHDDANMAYVLTKNKCQSVITKPLRC